MCKTIMRKYWRLALVLITCLSFILMFAYRQKYSKMSLIFEMMNAFQFQDTEAKCRQQLYDFKKSLKTDFATQEKIAGEPYWAEIFPGIYTYSTYWLQKKTRSLLFTKNLPQNHIRQIQCKLHYDNIKHVDQPKTNVIFVDKNDSRIFLFFECIPSTYQLPHSISFVFKNVSSVPLSVISKDSSNAQPIISNNSLVISHDSYTSHYTMCVKPLPPDFVDIYKLLEFISYHSHLGVRLFIFYESGLSIKAKRLLLEVCIKDSINILLLPWNLPYDAKIGFNKTEFFFLDCMHRVIARNYSKYALKLDLKEFLVPQDNWNFANLKDEFLFSMVQFQEKRFCSEFKSNVIAHNLNMPFTTMLKTKFLNENNAPVTAGYNVIKLKKIIVDSIDFHMWLYKKKAQKSNLIPSNSVVIHSYNKCALKDDQMVTEDKSMWKYKDVFFKSHLYVLAKQYNLIKD